MSDNGDQAIIDAGITLPCAKPFGWSPYLYECTRPYGHTGPHTSEGTQMRGARDEQDEHRTVTALAMLKGARE